jgi:hypothetical protein
VTLTFLYRAFCRLLQFVRLSRCNDAELAIEIVMLRHEVAVLRRPDRLGGLIHDYRMVA